MNSHDTNERIEDLQRAIEFTSWLIAEGVYKDDRFLRDRKVSYQAELAGLKSLNTEASCER